MALSDFSKQHFQRLAWYFAHGKSGGNSRIDTIDLDLVGEGLVARREEWAGQVRFAITPAGEHLLYLRKEDERRRRRPHHELGARLTTWLEQQDRLCWENIEFVVQLPTGPGAVRPDVLSMVKTLNPARMVPMVHEVKVSRSDFLVDVNNPAKRAAYFELADYVAYVLPDGLVEPSEVPPECGLIVETAPGAFRVVRKGRKNRRRPALTQGQWMALVLRNLDRSHRFDAPAALATQPYPEVVPEPEVPPGGLVPPRARPKRRADATPTTARPVPDDDRDTLDLDG